MPRQLGKLLRTVTFALAAVTAAPAMAAELLMFEDAGCVWCARWNAEIGPSYADSEEGRAAPLTRYDLRRDPVPDGLELRERVRYTPTFVLVEHGREVGRITGYPGEGAFWDQLDGLLARVSPRDPAPRDTSESADAGAAAGRPAPPGA